MSLSKADTRALTKVVKGEANNMRSHKIKRIFLKVGGEITNTDTFGDVLKLGKKSVYISHSNNGSRTKNGKMSGEIKSMARYALQISDENKEITSQQQPSPSAPTAFPGQ